MGHLLYACANYSAKIWALVGCALALALSCHTGDYIPSVTLTPLKNVYNKLHAAVLLHLQDNNRRKLLTLFSQEVKPGILFRHAQFETPKRQEELAFSCAFRLTCFQLSKKSVPF
jgi:hypothetical protein